MSLGDRMAKDNLNSISPVDDQMSMVRSAFRRNRQGPRRDGSV